VRQDGQQPGGQRGDLALVQAVADRLDRGDVIDGGERVVQRDEPDPALAACRLAYSLPLRISRPV
jgi:hypothetical protein